MRLVALAGWLAFCFAAAAIGAGASVDAGSFYAELVRPAWAPPAGLFGPVWTLLYALMGVAAWLVWRSSAGTNRRVALGLFIAQLAVNALWSWLFFAWRLGAASLADILLLWLLLVATLVAFYRIRALAGILLVPYLAWVSFAAVLNWTLSATNPELLAAAVP